MSRDLLFVLIVLLISYFVIGIPTTVTLTQGIYQGSVSSATNVTTFFSIPYAQQPIGNLRWRPPLAIPTPTGPLVPTAANVPVGCPQNQAIAIPTSESCLVLNVYGPANSNATNLPVYVWIHGGSFTNGAGALYDGSVFSVTGVAAGTPIIMVTINYRLGVLGFLADPQLFAESSGPQGQNTTGNYGFLDQLFAVQWVKQNIAAFGGNPLKITIGGESGGGVAVDMLLTSPLTPANLFQQAVVESGPIWPDPVISLQTAYNAQASAFLRSQTGCTTTACLRNLTVTQVLASESVDSSTNIFGAASQPVIDGYAMNSSIYTAYSSGNFIKVPMLIGSTQNETSLFTCPTFTNQVATSSQVQSFLVANYGNVTSNQIPNYYPSQANFANPLYYLNTVYSDSWLHCGTRRLARANTLAGAPTFLYTFTHAFASRTACYGSAHSFELPFLFPTLVSISGNSTLNTAETGLQTTMFLYWVNFIATGTPNSIVTAFSGATNWVQYNNTIDNELQLDITSSMRNGYYVNQCAFFDSLAVNTTGTTVQTLPSAAATPTPTPTVNGTTSTPTPTPAVNGTTSTPTPAPTVNGTTAAPTPTLIIISAASTKDICNLFALLAVVFMCMLQ